MGTNRNSKQKEKGLNMGDFCGTDGAAFSSKKMDWATPQDFFDKLDAEFHFDIDVCASDENAKCAEYFTEKDDCLAKDWSGRRCFMNPPYGRTLGRFVEKARSEAEKNGALVVCLIPARTDTSYWHDNIFGHATEIRFIRGRLKFGDGKNSAPFPSAVVVFDGTKKEGAIAS